MLNFLPAPLLGALTLILAGINLLFWFAIFFMIIPLKLIIPHQGWRKGCSRILEFIQSVWNDGNNLVFWLTQKIEWQIEGVEQLNPQGSYLLISNHQKAIDVPVLFKILNHRIPPIKFFVKQELIWLPFLGVAVWALDFPVMKRYTTEFLKKHPEFRGKDLETTRKACQKLKNSPFSVINFLEGTRFTTEKHQQQDSPYQNLLSPRFGTAAIVLANLGEFLTAVLDVTIVYPQQQSLSLWDMVCGRVSVIVIHVRELPLPEGRLKPWVQQLWQEKDATIDRILAEYATKTQNPIQNTAR